MGINSILEDERLRGLFGLSCVDICCKLLYIIVTLSRRLKIVNEKVLMMRSFFF